MSDPSTPNNQMGGFKSNSAGTPHTTPLQTGPLTALSSISATNSPVSGMHNNLSSNNLQSLDNNNNRFQQPQQYFQPQTPTQQPQQSQMQPSVSNNNLGSLTSQPIPTPQQRLISSSCFEFFYIEMIDYIMKSSSDKTQAHKKLDKLGYKVGHRLVERLSNETPLFPELLDAVKFICKVFWTNIFKKTIDGLKTNHKGVFVLTDSKFQWLQHLSFDATANNKDCSEYVQFAAGLIKGAMSNFGFKCIVSFDIQQVSTCVFTIKIES
ncbi:hypothetical protein DICPUDRAFT_78642 [Dictyostelium purpureum]|uniref:Uncharacterized protein n=1 Tax=Dictyostelium purpureum TaxID=5786 RepID=F0ZK47_DICPU|nr:uncharacterized protein DICPUDRAFT_78642 [Dictyostelium purpureum]EGC35688.1 hypothetical protein DICPUDRAFT_78642 [Dictyostelium purpureum]|eukprot:XP_003287788.1 hypothetical protein DICPUDRAFT_78642 [Dictyostelium purpureum]